MTESRDDRTRPATVPAPVSRRGLLRVGVALAAACAAPSRAAMTEARTVGQIALFNTHTGERLQAVFREGNEYLPDALAAIDRVLRDHRTGEVTRIDVGLLDQLHRLGGLVDARQPFHVISGYRSPQTNAMLAAASDGVARGSLHLEGRAIDIRLPGRDLGQIHRAALSMRGGGVGFYRRSDFVHLDTGRVRSW